MSNDLPRSSVELANKEVFCSFYTRDEKYRPVNMRDLRRRDYSVVWCKTLPVRWDYIRDNNARCFPFPKGLIIPGQADKRCDLQFYKNQQTFDILPQWSLPSGVGNTYTVSGTFGTFGDLANRTRFLSTSIGAQWPTVTDTPNDWVVHFLTGDMAGKSRKLCSYDQVTGEVNVVHSTSGKAPFPGWGNRGIQIGDTFKIRKRSGGNTTPVNCCNWELTSKVFKSPNSNSALSLYKSVRFKYVAASVDPNVIGDFAPAGYPIFDSDTLTMAWREIHYHWQPWIQKIMPSDIFPSAAINTHGRWPIQNGATTIDSVTRVLLGTYQVPGTSTNVPIYVFDISYNGGAFTKRYELPTLYTIGNMPRGYRVEMWVSTRRNMYMPRVRWGRGHNLSFADYYYQLIGNYVYVDHRWWGGLSVDNQGRNHIQFNSPVWLRARNQKTGGVTDFSRQHIIAKFRAHKARLWNYPMIQI